MSRTDPFTGRPALAARYARESRRLTASRLTASCWLAVVLVPLFGALDLILHPGLIRTFIPIRVGMMLNAGAVLIALRTARGRRWVTALSYFTFVVTGLGIVLMTVFNGGGSSPYYAGINLVVLAAAVLMPWDAGLSIACCATLIAAYAGTCLAWSGVPDGRIFGSNLYFLVSTALITVVSHRLGAAARRHEFLQRVALEEAGRHRDEFLANITHELRTPLAAILGFCEMLSDFMPDATGEQRGWLARIRDNALTLYRLIVQLLDFSKIEAGAMRLVRERFTLEGIVTKVAADMQAIAGADGPEIRTEIAADAPPIVGDPARTEEILTNLASNALKFSRGRPIVLRLRRGHIGASRWDRIVPEPGPESHGHDYAEVAVVDGGEGITPADLRQLFVAFRQLDGSSTRRHGGTGLGLAISARLAAAMRGHIAVRSRDGAGSTFALLVPVAEREAARGALAPEPVAEHQVARSA